MRLPSTRSLEAMVAVARLGSLAAAGSELGMSVPALSRRIALLEADLGIRLFERLPRGFVLTSVGAAYHAQVAPALALLRSAGGGGVGRASGNTVRLTTIPAFATRWLLLSLPRFTAAHPGIEVDVRNSSAFEELDSRDIDLAVRLAPDSTMPDELLLPIHLFPIWGVGRTGPATPDALIGPALLGPDHRPEFWTSSRSGTGSTPRRPASGTWILSCSTTSRWRARASRSASSRWQRPCWTRAGSWACCPTAAAPRAASTS